MEINTRFDVGNKVFFMNNNKVCEANIERINLIIEGITIEIKYRVKVKNTYKYLLESNIFATKQELLNTL